MASVRALSQSGRRLPFGIEVVGFAEEEGQRYKATFLDSGALTGDFDAAGLDQLEAEGISMRQAIRTTCSRCSSSNILSSTPARVQRRIRV